MTHPTSIMTVPQDPESETGTEYYFTRDDYDYVLVSQGSSLEMKFQQGATPSHYRFRETDGGAVHMQDVASGMYLHLTSAGSGFELGPLEGALVLVPKAVSGLLQLHYLHSFGNYYVGSAATPGPPSSRALVVNSEPVGYWEAHPVNAPLGGGTSEWLNTYNADHHFSPRVFLQHMNKIIQHQDVQHTGEDYWQGLYVMVPGTSLTYDLSIMEKIHAWLNRSYVPGAPADAVMQAASTHFYTAASGEVNELDPERPPDWPGIDDELGKDPYPG